LSTKSLASAWLLDRCQPGLQDSIGARESCSADDPLRSSSSTLLLAVTVEESSSDGLWRSASQIDPGKGGALETSGFQNRKPQLDFLLLVIRTVSQIKLFTKPSNESQTHHQPASLKGRP
jgi:hypothetical protein